MLVLLLAFWLQTPPAFTGEAERAWAEREKTVGRLTTPETLRERQAEIRRKMAMEIGGLPEARTPLNAKSKPLFEREGYRVEGVAFESLPGFVVTANLYVPTRGAGPYPAVLGVAGHSDAGKADATYQRAWITLARRGYVVLAFDPPGQGERIDPNGPGAGVPEHIRHGHSCLLTGTAFARYEIWDGIRAFDYLLTRPEVDERRIAVAGNSGGGTQAAYLAVFEPRLAAVVASCYTTRWRELWSGPGPQDAEQVFPGFVRDGFDFSDFLLAFAPRPLLVTSAGQDFFPIAGARASYEEARGWYERMDAPGRLRFFEYDDPHGWSLPRREAAYRFFAEHLKGVKDEEPEKALEVEPAEALRTGFWNGRTVFDLCRERAEEMYPRRKAPRASPEELRAMVRKRLGLAAESSARKRAGDFGSLKPGVLVVGDVETAPDDSRIVMRVVPQGFEAKLPERGRGYDAGYQFAARALLVGQTALGTQVGEVLEALKKLRATPGVGRITIEGRGAGAILALFAGAAEGEAVREEDPPFGSYMEVVRNQKVRVPATLVVPGILEDFDLDDLRAGARKSGNR